MSTNRKFKVGDEVFVKCENMREGIVVEIESPEYAGMYTHKIELGASFTLWAPEEELILKNPDISLEDYITEDMDFTGCHPVIAEALRKNKRIKCKVSDNDIENATKVYYVFSYDPKRCKYKTGLFEWKYAEPIKKPEKVVIVKSYKEIVKWLLANMYTPRSNHWFRESGLSWNNEMFDYCGKVPSRDYQWLPEWLTELEM